MHPANIVYKDCTNKLIILSLSLLILTFLLFLVYNAYQFKNVSIKRVRFKQDNYDTHCIRESTT